MWLSSSFFPFFVSPFLQHFVILLYCYSDSPEVYFLGLGNIGKLEAPVDFQLFFSGIDR